MNKKIMALLLATALTTGMGGFGTYAYFTDTDVVKDKVNITMGTLSTDVGVRELWKANSIGGEAKPGNGGFDLDFTDVKPGDSFSSIINVTNNGTLKSNVKINVPSKFNDAFDINLEVLENGGQNATLVKNSIEIKEFDIKATIGVKVTVTAKNSIGNTLNGQTIKVDEHTFVEVISEQLKQS